MSELAYEAPDGAPSVPARVLIVDDEPELVRMLRRMLESEGFDVAQAHDDETLFGELDACPEVVLLDLNLGVASGTDFIGEIRARSADSEIIIMTGFATIDSAVSTIRAGAFDYLEKPFSDRHRVIRTLNRAVDHRKLRVRNRELEGELGLRTAFAAIVGQSASIRRVTQLVTHLSSNESNVLIQAESGTGKELIARAIHETSPRSSGPFVPVDCGALPEGIAEAELFGYETGAFTGATRAAPGLFRRAQGGTLFLDEIGELSPLLQSKLLRAIQEREVRPLGSPDAISIDVRIVAATNRELAVEVEEGRFRSDLFYRLRVVSVELPPLRERREDIPVLATYFLNTRNKNSNITGFEPDALEQLATHRWDGNVRELQNTIEAAVALARGPRLTAADLRLLPQRGGQRVSEPEDIPLSFSSYEKACITHAIRSANGDIRQAASILGVGRSTLYRKLKAHGIKV